MKNWIELDCTHLYKDSLSSLVKMNEDKVIINADAIHHIGYFSNDKSDLGNYVIKIMSDFFLEAHFDNKAEADEYWKDIKRKVGCYDAS